MAKGLVNATLWTIILDHCKKFHTSCQQMSLRASRDCQISIYWGEVIDDRHDDDDDDGLEVFKSNWEDECLQWLNHAEQLFQPLGYQNCWWSSMVKHRAAKIQMLTQIMTVWTSWRSLILTQGMIKWWTVGCWEQSTIWSSNSLSYFNHDFWTSSQRGDVQNAKG